MLTDTYSTLWVEGSFVCLLYCTVWWCCVCWCCVCWCWVSVGAECLLELVLSLYWSPGRVSSWWSRPSPPSTGRCRWRSVWRRCSPSGASPATPPSGASCPSPDPTIVLHRSSCRFTVIFQRGTTGCRNFPSSKPELEVRHSRSGGNSATAAPAAGLPTLATLALIYDVLMEPRLNSDS